MKSKIVLLVLLVVVIAAMLIPVQQQRTVVIKAPFLKTYTTLLDAQSWLNWRPDIHQKLLKDSAKIALQTQKGAFTITVSDTHLYVQPAGNLFTVKENNGQNLLQYDYTVAPYQGPNETLLTVYYKANCFAYLLAALKPQAFVSGHTADLKRFMETDSLYYGYSFFRVKVPATNLIEIKHSVLKQRKFTAAATMLTQLQAYVKAHHLKQVQPVIAQFIPKSKDSVQVNVGLFIDNEATDANSINFVKMPAHGVFLSVNYKGKFMERGKAYTAMQKYFSDHNYQSVILPFESYPGDKLPVSDNDWVNIQINFATIL